MAEILKGAPVAAAITEELKLRVEKLKTKSIIPTLAILRVGERPDDMAYERGALKRCEQAGIRTISFPLPAGCEQAELMKTIGEINKNDAVHGCLMFRPLPAHLDERAACEALRPEKDVDSMTAASLNAVFTGCGMGFPPCTAQSCLELLDYYGIDAAGKNVAVIGRSLVIGKPVSMLLQARNATVTMCHTKTQDMPGICRRADILVVAAGKAGVVDASYTNPRQIVVDVGINADLDGNVCGDVKFDEVSQLVRAITPVPAGIGSVTTAVLAKHVIEAAERISL